MDESCPREFQLLTYSHNKFVDFIRNRNRIREHETTLSELDEDSYEGNSRETVDPATTPQQTLERTEFWNDVFDAVEELNPRDRELFLLRLVEEKSVHEIAAFMNLSDKTASKAVRRMEERLREICVKRGLPETYPEIVGRLPPPRCKRSLPPRSKDDPDG